MSIKNPVLDLFDAFAQGLPASWALRAGQMGDEGESDQAFAVGRVELGAVEIGFRPELNLGNILAGRIQAQVVATLLAIQLIRNGRNDALDCLARVDVDDGGCQGKKQPFGF